MQSHILSIHSPQSTRKTIMKLKHKLCDENDENPDKDIADKIDVDDDCSGAKPTYA